MIRRSTLQTFAESITESLETIAEKIEKVESLIGEAGNVLDSGSDECVGDECDEVVTPVVDEDEDDDETSEDYTNDEAETEDDDDEENVVAVPVEEDDDDDEEDEEATEAEMYAASIRRTRGKATNFSVNKKPSPASRYAKVKDFLNGKM